MSSVRILPALAAVSLAAAVTFGNTSTEVEPNNEGATANVMSLGDTVAATLDPGLDVDYFAVDLTAGDVLDVLVLGEQCDHWFYAELVIVGPDSTTVLAQGRDGRQGGDCERAVLRIGETGRYFLVVADAYGAGDPAYAYRLTARLIEVHDVEPNDAPADASPVSGDSAVAFIEPEGDTDYFTVQLEPGTRTSFSTSGAGFGSCVYVPVDLFSPAGDSLGHWESETDLRVLGPLSYNVTAAGTYLVRTHAATNPVQSSCPSTGAYTLYLDTHRHGPADTLTTFAGGLDGPIAAAGTPDGGLVVVERTSSRLMRIGPDRLTSQLAHVAAQQVTDVAFDGAGRVLVTGLDTNGIGAVWSFVGAGAQSALVSGLGNPMAIAIESDGEFWVLDAVREQLVEFDPYGVAIDSVGFDGQLSVLRPDLEFSPAGALHLSNRGAVYRVEADALVQVVEVPDNRVWGIAFDRDGYLYATIRNTVAGRLALYDPSYQLVNDSLATDKLYDSYSGNRDHDLVFLRDGAGGVTSRLVALSYVRGTVMEFNPAGIRAPGANVIDHGLVLIENDDLAQGSVGAAYADTLRTSGGPASVTWSVALGELPAGLQLDAATGVVSGIPRAGAHRTIRVRAESAAAAGERRLVIDIATPSITHTDAALAALQVPSPLTDDVRRALDFAGNDNGRYDIGDFRAYLARVDSEVVASLLGGIGGGRPDNTPRP